MKITEMLVNSLMHTKIFELAYAKQNIINYAENSVDVVLITLAKLLVFDSPNDYNHWIQIVDSPLLKLNRRKRKDNNKTLDYSTLRKIFFEEPLGHTDTAQEWINDAYNETVDGQYKYHEIPIKQKTPHQVHKELELIIHEICLLISNEKFRSIRPIIQQFL